MKKNIFPILMLLFLGSCNNDIMDEPQNDLCEVCINVSALDVKVEPMTRATSPANEALDGIYYSLVNTSTKKEYFGEQTTSKNPSDFGNVKLWLPAGTYEAFVMGSGKLNPKGQSYMYTDNSYKTHHIFLKNKDSFFKRQALQVSKETTNIDMDLTRLNSALVIRLKDELPNDIAKVKVRLTYLPIWLVESDMASHEGSTGMSSVFEDELTVTGNKVEEYTYYVLPQANKDVTITLCDAFGAELGSTNVKVTYYKNRKTVIEGNILDVVQQRPLNITVTDDWGEDNVIPLK